MERRNFLKVMALGGTAIALIHTNLIQPRRLMATNSTPESLSLSVLTDQPDRALDKLQNFFNAWDLNAGTLKFEDYILPGTHTGDMVLIHKNRLVDFREAQDELSGKLQGISKSLDLPREMNNPVMMKFSTLGKKIKPTTINVFHRETLIQQFETTESLDGLEISGTKGALNLTLHQGYASIVEASCKHKTCMDMGSIHNAGENLVCIPNELRVTIAGENAYGVDGIVS